MDSTGINPTGTTTAPRRRFLQKLGAWAGVTAAVPAVTKAQTPATAGGSTDFLPKYALAQKYKSLKQSSYDRTGGNADRAIGRGAGEGERAAGDSQRAAAQSAGHQHRTAAGGGA